MKVKLLVGCQDGNDHYPRRTIVEFKDDEYAGNLCRRRMAIKATSGEVKDAGDIPVIERSKPKGKPEPKPKPAPKPAPKPEPEKDGK